jgi:hypothetical protein
MLLCSKDWSQAMLTQRDVFFWDGLTYSEKEGARTNEKI